MDDAGSFKIVTYNVHGCRGLDRRVRPGRIAAVLREIDADIIGLQEVWSIETEGGKHDHARAIADKLGMNPHFGGNWNIEERFYGNLTLSRWPVIALYNYDISREGRERRGCLRADILVNDTTLLHVFNLHLGLRKSERQYQVSRLMSDEILGSRELSGPRIVLGDFNEWRQGRTTRQLAEHIRSGDLGYFLQRRRTYPAILPLFHLDHIYYDLRLKLERLTLHRSRTALVASDHLPLVASFSLREP